MEHCQLVASMSYEGHIERVQNKFSAYVPFKLKTPRLSHGYILLLLGTLHMSSTFLHVGYYSWPTFSQIAPFQLISRSCASFSSTFLNSLFHYPKLISVFRIHLISTLLVDTIIRMTYIRASLTRLYKSLSGIESFLSLPTLHRLPYFIVSFILSYTNSHIMFIFFLVTYLLWHCVCSFLYIAELAFNFENK